MSVLSELADDASKGTVQTSELLRRTKLVAARMQLPLLGDWVNKELNGYDKDDDDIPSYRGPFAATVRGHFRDALGGEARNHLIPPLAFQKKWQEGWLFRNIFLTPISELEALVDKDRPEVTLRAPWDANVVASIPNLLDPDRQFMRGYFCYEAWREISSAQVASVTDAVRNRLLDVLIDLEAIAPPDAGEAGAVVDAEVQAQTPQIVQQHIYNNSNVAVSGTHVTQVMMNTPATEQELGERLAELGVDPDDIAELIEALPEDSEDGSLGPKVRGWLTKATAKLSSQTATATVTALVTEFVKSQF